MILLNAVLGKCRVQRADRKGNMTTTDHPATAERYVTTDEVAEFLGKPVTWVYNNAGPLGIPRYRLGNHYRYRLSEVAEWLSGQRQQ
jgi:excisionase family DNA binding protein